MECSCFCIYPILFLFSNFFSVLNFIFSMNNLSALFLILLHYFQTISFIHVLTSFLRSSAWPCCLGWTGIGIRWKAYGEEVATWLLWVTQRRRYTVTQWRSPWVGDVSWGPRFLVLVKVKLTTCTLGCRCHNAERGWAVSSGQGQMGQHLENGFFSILISLYIYNIIHTESSSLNATNC